jgi:hypothetical protein
MTKDVLKLSRLLQAAVNFFLWQQQAYFQQSPVNKQEMTKLRESHRQFFVLNIFALQPREFSAKFLQNSIPGRKYAPWNYPRGREW